MKVGSFGTLFHYVKIMTEQTKKPRRKRRTKAQIEAEKAAAKKKEEAVVTSKEVVKEEPVASVVPTVSNDYRPKTGLAKIKERAAQRKLAEENRL